MPHSATSPANFSLPLQMGKLELREMRKEDEMEAIQLISSEYAANEPLLTAYFQQFGLEEDEIMRGLQDYWTAYLENSEGRVLSAVVVDHSCGGTIVGACFAADMTYRPNFTEEKKESVQRVMAWMSVL